MKKIIVAGTIAAGMALAALPVLAGYTPPKDPCCGNDNHTTVCCPEVNVSGVNTSTVRTINVSVANSGLNKISQHSIGFNTAGITTGLAVTEASVGNTVGFTSTTVAAPTSGKVNVSNINVATVGTVNGSVANSGLNKIHQTSFGANTAGIGSGDAQAISTVVNVVGSQVTNVTH